MMYWSHAFLRILCHLVSFLHTRVQNAILVLALVLGPREEEDVSLCGKSEGERLHGTDE